MPVPPQAPFCIKTKPDMRRCRTGHEGGALGAGTQEMPHRQEPGSQKAALEGASSLPGLAERRPLCIGACYPLPQFARCGHLVSLPPPARESRSRMGRLQHGQ